MTRPALAARSGPLVRQSLLTSGDASAWRAALPAERCVTGSLEYVRIVERQTGCAARLLVLESERGRVAYPYLLRPVEPLPFAGGRWKGRWDTFTPEYTGPILVGPGAFRGPGEPRLGDLLERHCREQGIVAEFAHLNPWHSAAEQLDPGCVESSREIVYLDLSAGEEATWTRSLGSDARRMTRKAQQAGVRVRHAESPDDVRAFHDLYTRTMERRQARQRYFFPVGYFLDFLETMPGSSFFALAEHQGRLVAGGLYLHGGPDVYWHLSAADMDFAHLRAVNGYVWETIRWAVARGKRRMLLGGGYEPDDGVFRFKASLSPLRARFSTYRRVHDAGAYAELARAWSESHGGSPPDAGFFPAYRVE